MPQRDAAIDQVLRGAYQAARAGDYATADRALTALCTAEPELAAALHLHGMVLHRLGRTDEAWVKLKRALEIAPNEAALYLDWGNLLDDRGDPDGALGAYERALAIDPRRSDAA